MSIDLINLIQHCGGNINTFLIEAISEDPTLDENELREIWEHYWSFKE